MNTLNTFNTDDRQGSYVNDQQKQLVMQAQQSIQSFQQPQDSNVTHEGDNPDHIFETLQALDPSLFEQQKQQQLQMQEQQLQQLQMQELQQQQQQQNQQQMPQQNGQHMEQQKQGFFDLYSIEIKMSIICAIVFIIVSILPIEKIIFKYYSLDRIPYSNLILKAIISAIVFFILIKLIIKI